MPTNLSSLIAVVPSVTDLLTGSTTSIRSGSVTIELERHEYTEQVRSSREGGVDSYVLRISDAHGDLATVSLAIMDGGDPDLVELDPDCFADVVDESGDYLRAADWDEILTSLGSAEGKIQSDLCVVGA